MDNDRSIRRLTNLSKSSSTARVLNLYDVHRRHCDFPGIVKSPFFKNRLLNRAIILKHKLRGNEIELFDAQVGSATKVLLPIDAADLRSGAHYFFVGQRDFTAVTDEVFGAELRPGARDRIVLDQLNELPSLDPFLLREYLRRSNIEPAREYFNISESDILNMQKFIQTDVQALVSMSGGDQRGMPANRLVEKLLSSRPEADFGPLREVLRLEDREFLDGIFAWRGFLYYKWVLSDAMAKVDQTVRSLATAQPRGIRDAESAEYIPHARARIIAAIGRSVQSVQDMLGEYDKAYDAMTQDGKPAAFRDFLIVSPQMFMNLGRQLGAIQHIVSFWSYRFTRNKTVAVSYTELMDILMDFEDSLICDDGGEDAYALRAAG